jgi:trans-aconitate methyltransferase
MTSPAHDPAQYLRFADERLRPALDLIARIPHAVLRPVVDLGCGAGNALRCWRCASRRQPMRAQFVAACAAALRPHYPMRPVGAVLLPYRRLFILAAKNQ